MKRKFLIIALSIACTMGAMGAAILEPVTDLLEFGELDEAKGPQTMRTYVVNKGDEPVQIKRVSTTCGCTGVKYSPDLIEPGDSAWLDITYDPRNRFGEFEKSVKVYPASGGVVPVVFHGRIRNTEESIARRYPVQAGPLRLSERKVMCGPVKQGKQRSFFINFYNMSDQIVTPEVTSESDGLSVSLGPSPIEPRSVGSISIIPNCKENLPTGNHQLKIKLNPDISDPNSEIETIEVFIEIE